MKCNAVVLVRQDMSNTFQISSYISFSSTKLYFDKFCLQEETSLDKFCL